MMQIKKFFSLIVLFIFSTLAYSQVKIEATKNQYGTGQPENGIYPVQITITLPSNIENKIQLKKSLFPDKDFSLLKEILITENQKTLTYTDQEKCQVNQKYYYLVEYTISATKEKKQSNIDYGYGALTPEKYFMTMDSLVKISHSKLILMNKPHNLDKLGKEISNGELTGTLLYQTKVKGFSGVVTMQYENYSDNPNWTFNGNTNTTANMLGNGKMNGIVTIEGMYPGQVDYNNVIIENSMAGGGTYDVTPQNQPKTKLDYTWTFKSE